MFRRDEEWRASHNNFIQNISVLIFVTTFIVVLAATYFSHKHWNHPTESEILTKTTEQEIGIAEYLCPKQTIAFVKGEDNIVRCKQPDGFMPDMFGNEKPKSISSAFTP